MSHYTLDHIPFWNLLFPLNFKIFSNNLKSLLIPPILIWLIHSRVLTFSRTTISFSAFHQRYCSAEVSLQDSDVTDASKFDMLLSPSTSPWFTNGLVILTSCKAGSKDSLMMPKSMGWGAVKWNAPILQFLTFQIWLSVLTATTFFGLNPNMKHSNFT